MAADASASSIHPERHQLCYFYRTRTASECIQCREDERHEKNRIFHRIFFHFPSPLLEGKLPEPKVLTELLLESSLFACYKVLLDMKMRMKGYVSRDSTSQRVSRSQKKYSENAQTPEKKVSDLITSSTRRQKAKKNEVPAPTADSNDITSSVCKEDEDTCVIPDSVTDVSMYYKSCDGGGHPSDQTIFSPAFHSSKLMGGSDSQGGHLQADMRSNCDTVNYSECLSSQEMKGSDRLPTSVYRFSNSILEIDEDMSSKTSNATLGDLMFNQDSDALNNACDMEVDGARISSEVSAIYFAMKNSKLECVDEHGQDTIAAEVYVQDEEYDDFDDFDPYLFMKNLPELSSVVPTFRTMLLPKRTRSCPATSLVLDLDETLVHSSLEPCNDADFTFPVNFNLQEYTVYVRCRPYLRDFLERVATLFEVIIFTASQSIYAEQLLNVLDPKRKIFRHRVFRDSCVYVEGNYLKDLSVLGRDLAHVIIVDNSPQAFGFQVDNGIPIESWFDDCTDRELLHLLPFLESLVGVEDVRPLIANKYNLREKIAAASLSSIKLQER
ncbi:hypothetical protein SAY87_019408 [Trapa incisa]|uniref:FCP1 homology domain-containing protein n=1 Tax=Trapa incisa TaxID=236973 RepID=A0AAN7K505_9MYRT|nr:hypothetical protein SAY87_019408 [Trapa incisa]